MTEKRLYETLDTLAAMLPDHGQDDLTWLVRLLTTDTEGRFTATVRRWLRDGKRGDVGSARVR